jgi:hypothetical protein
MGGRGESRWGEIGDGDGDILYNGGEIEKPMEIDDGIGNGHRGEEGDGDDDGHRG